MYTMKQACALTHMRYETLKFYCNQGLVPNVKRDDQNRRVFDERDIAWINSLTCLKSCDLSLAEMKDYIALCQQGIRSIPQRKELLTRKREELLARQKDLQSALDYIDWKQNFYDDVLAGRTPYVSNLIVNDEAT